MKKTFIVLLCSGLLIALVHGQQNQSFFNLCMQPSHAEINLSKKTTSNFYANAHRARLFDFNNAVITQAKKSDTIHLNLYNDRSFKAVVRSKNTNVNGTTSLVCQLVDFRYAYCFISFHNGSVHVSIDIPELTEKYITRTKGSLQYLFWLDNNNLDVLESGPPLLPPPPLKKPIDSTNSGSQNSSMDTQQHIYTAPPTSKSTQQIKAGVNDTANIDVMIVYTPAAMAWANTNEGSIYNTIADAMAKCNLVSTNSELLINYNLVYSGLVNYVEVDPSTDLNRLTDIGNGHMDTVHLLRDQYAADLVVLFSYETQTGGLAWMLTNKYGNPTNGFSLTRVQQASWTYTTIHEIGHNMGAHHHKQQNFQPGPTSWFNWPANNWSAGWRWTGSDNGKYCSVMTYENGTYFSDGITHSRVPHFSNPDIDYMSVPTGHAADGDNARTLREVKHYVAQYRDTNTLLYCAAYGDNPFYHISNVQAGTINKASGGSNYSDFSFYSTDVTLGDSIQVTVDIENPFPANQLLVWVDWNDNKNFTDAEELVYTSAVGDSAQYVFYVKPPAGTSPGPKRMRLRLHISSHGPNNTPCGASDHGEVEDYTLNVISPTALAPIADFTASATQITAGDSVVFTDNSSNNPTSWIWEFAVGHPPGTTTPDTSNLQNNTVFYHTPGTYSVKLTAGNNYGSNTHEKSAYITVAPLSSTLSVNASATDSIICQGLQTQLFASPTGGSGIYSFNWHSSPAGFSSSSQNPIITPNTTKTYTVVVNDGTVADSASITITVNPLPDTPGTISGDASVCQEQNNVTYSINPVAHASSYVWSLPTGASGSSSGNSISVDFGTSAVSGDISVKGSNACAQGTEVFKNITVNPLPETPNPISGDASVCQEQNNITYSINPVAHASSYVWSLPTGASGSSSGNFISVDFGTSAVSGNISVKGSNACGQGTEVFKNITVHNKPTTPSITLNGNILLSDAPAGNQWYDQDGIIPGAVQQNYTVTSDGDYYVIVTISGCSSEPSNTINVATTGLALYDENAPANLYPNPFSDKLYIENVTGDNISFKIYNSFGQLVHKGQLIDKTVWDAKNFASGLYFIRFENQESFSFVKIVKE